MAYLVSYNTFYETYNGGFIILNFPKSDGTHGCRFNCPFCGWKKSDLVTKEILPTHKDIDDYLKYYHGPYVKLSGGGDPLFEFEKNKDKIIDLINYCHQKHRLVTITTREYETVRKYFKTDLSIVDSWSFSVENEDPNVRSLLKEIYEFNNGDPTKQSIVSKIYNLTSKNMISDEEVISYTNYYKDYVWRVLFNSNYLKPPAVDSIGNLQQHIIDITNGAARLIYRDENSTLQLIGDKIYVTTAVNDILNRR